MTSTVTKNDKELLISIGEHKALTVKQLSNLSQRSSQVLRRRMRTLIKEELIITRTHGYVPLQKKEKGLLLDFMLSFCHKSRRNCSKLNEEVKSGIGFKDGFLFPWLGN